MHTHTHTTVQQALHHHWYYWMYPQKLQIVPKICAKNVVIDNICVSSVNTEMHISRGISLNGILSQNVRVVAKVIEIFMKLHMCLQII